ncbi:type II toxin-antitoxin system RelE/ParE family toxin [Nitrosomonas sp.]|uniref:type II toxin-antitoxin system RelE/ParE family toxin n=1 Tax=Nitrosomonas sp. TaxID=42353 RepID=UPI003305ABB9
MLGFRSQCWAHKKLLVCKFHSQNQLYLLGCSIDEVVHLVYLKAIGPYKNFYRDLKHL